MSVKESCAALLGFEPKKHGEISPEARKLHDEKKARKTHIKCLAEDEIAKRANHEWRNRRWAFLIGVNLLFVLSYRLDIQVLEGSLTASRLIGFHLADLNSSLQVMLAHKEVLINLAIGSLTIFVIWFLAGGRTFCSWVCPYHFIAEWMDKLRAKLGQRGLVVDHQFPRGVRAVFYIVFALAALISGYTVFETISPVGIVSRALIYGPGLALAWVALILLFEVLYSKRAWCRYVCPIGMTYGAVGILSPTRVVYHLENCIHEGECLNVCEVPHVLECVKKGRAEEVTLSIGADCTRCGACVDICPSNSLRFEIAGLNKLM